MSSTTVAVTVKRGAVAEIVHVRPGENLLMALVNADLPVAYQCTTGKCATCRLLMEIPAGSAAPPSETERYRLGDNAIGQGYRLACRVFVEGPLTVDLELSY